jgi:hypothetical protein
MVQQHDINEVTHLLLDLAKRLQALDDSLGEYERDYVEKAEIHNAAHTKAFLAERQNDSPQYVCKAVADDATADQRLAMNLAEAIVKAQKRKIEILRERIGVGRTVVASLRAELELERVPNQQRYR